MLPQMQRVVVGVDPSGARGPEDLNADEIGIVVVGLGMDKKYYVMADLTALYSPEGWGRAAVNAYKKFGADKIVAERNFGGDMVAAIIRGIDQNVAFRLVTAARGKEVRAEPIASLYERGLAFHAGTFLTLEEQMTNFLTSPKGYTGSGSPNNADAMVHAMTELSGHDFSYGLTELNQEMLRSGSLEIPGAPAQEIDPMNKVAKSPLIKPAMPENALACPQCQATCIVKINNQEHCNSCGHDWNMSGHSMLKVPNRKDLANDKPRHWTEKFY
jgi:Terminase RNaseH-like domain